MESKSVTTPVQRLPIKASTFFWITVIFLAIITVGLTGFAYYRSTLPTEYNPDPTVVERIFSDAAKQAVEAVEPTLQQKLDQVYAPVYAAIPKYVDFHYSVYGEYAELTQAAMGTMSEKIHETLYASFEERYLNLAGDLDSTLMIEYEKAIREGIRDAVPEDATDLPLGAVTTLYIDNAIARISATVPLATAAITVTAASPLKAAFLTMAKKIAQKVAAKAAAKGAVKGGSFLAGAGTGALLCSWSGPGAALCGIAGGVAAWLITDVTVITLDEFFNREEFEAELRELIRQDQQKKLIFLQNAIGEKAEVLDEITKDFRMGDLNSVDASPQENPPNQ